MLASISGDENEITLGFKQSSNVRNVATKHLHVCIGQNQRIKPILSGSLERCLINKSFLVPIILPTLLLLTYDLSTASRTPTDHHVNKIFIDRLEWRNVLQFVSESCCKLLRPTIITKCCNPCHKMCSFHLLKNAVNLIKKCASYYKMRRYYKMPKNSDNI